MHYLAHLALPDKFFAVLKRRGKVKVRELGDRVSKLVVKGSKSSLPTVEMDERDFKKRGRKGTL